MLAQERAAALAAAGSFIATRFLGRDAGGYASTRYTTLDGARRGEPGDGRSMIYAQVGDRSIHVENV